jgi:hypothetical protein
MAAASLVGEAAEPTIAPLLQTGNSRAVA